MIITLAAALSLAASMAIDVPYLPQTDALCGGAAAAMVFRYWGDAHADVQEFAPLVDRRAGGIATDALDCGGHRARVAHDHESTARSTALGARVHDGQPVIVLLPDRGDRYHYVVVIGVSDEAIVVHDPAWGPSRTIRAPDFERAWKAAGFWSLVILPPRGSPPARQPAARRNRRHACGAGAPDRRTGRRVRRAAESRARRDPRAGTRSRRQPCSATSARECPGAAGPIRELSGVRFAQRRWSDAAALAREVAAAPSGATSTRSTCSAPASSCRTTTSARCGPGIRSASRA